MPVVGDTAVAPGWFGNGTSPASPMTGDRSPLHYDPDVASRTRCGGIIVKGGITFGLLDAVVAEDLPGPGSVFLHVA